MATEPPSYSGNGSGLTTKEMLVRLDGKVDAVLDQMTAIRVQHATHEAKAFHSEGKEQVDELSNEVRALKVTYAKWFGGAVVCFFVLNIVVYVLTQGNAFGFIGR